MITVTFRTTEWIIPPGLGNKNSPDCAISMGIDPLLGVHTGISVTQFLRGLLQVYLVDRSV